MDFFMDLSKKKTIILLSLFLLLLSSAYNQRQILFRISVENTQNHVQTKGVALFAQEISDILGPEYKVQFYDSAQLFRDQEVITALARGSLEMAVPGTWQLDRYVPDISYFLLPQFWGKNSKDYDEFLESDKGQLLLNKIEGNLGVIVPGLWMDLGPAHIFTTRKQIKSFKDLKGLKIRVAGGEANRLRINALGAQGVIIAWPDLIPRIKDHSIDGILTTFETINSANLWEGGIKYAFTDYEYFAQYVPIVSVKFWKKLSTQQKNEFVSTWNKIVLEQRKQAQLAQIEAINSAQSHGIIVTAPQKDDLNQTQKEVRNLEGQFIKQLSIGAYLQE
ncbi:TRAP transporter substrate-binding protein DctP [Spirochaeta cellobiosiphila]|uniref:TRAP transporter substrate-binding protein DctP n=1 Tax=Spirochaeta cellobiosiphila TaxID=504483 RepID=UPI00040C2D0A|nr:TRAP transporter substrate-binding protein DctP [Spirochaeta cellobiosiphila]